jgi:hypothetical protein
MEKDVAKLLRELQYLATASKDFKTSYHNLIIVSTLIRGNLNEYYLPDHNGKLRIVSLEMAIDYIKSMSALPQNETRGKAVKMG